MLRRVRVRTAKRDRLLVQRRIATAATVIAVCALAAAVLPGSAGAAERKAVVTGVADRALASALAVAIGDEPAAPANRLDARRRAISAAESADALLRSEGYYDAEITPDVDEGERPRAVLKITLGPRTLIATPSIVWEGPPPPTDVQATAREAIDLPDKLPARAAEVLAAEGRVVAALEQDGYADAAAVSREVIVDHADHTLRPAYKVSSGSLVRLGELRLSAKSRTRKDYIAKLTPWKPGDAYTPFRVAELERRLTETQAYDTVAVSLTPVGETKDGLRPVLVSLTDRSRRSFDFSAGYSTTEGPDFDVRYSIFNTLHRADTITFEARLAQIDSRLGGEISLPHFTAPGRTAKASGYYFRTVTDAYSETGTVLATDFTQRSGAASFVTLGASVTDSEVSDKELGRSKFVALRAVGAFLLDRTNASLNPVRGFKLDARAVPTLLQGDGDQLYVRLTGQASAYLPFGREASTVLAGRVRLGSIIGGSIPAVPAQDRFFGGGGGSVRGYEFQGVGPRYADDTPRGGLSLVEASIELRQRLGQTKFGGVLFLDAGSVGDSSTPDFKRVSPAVGVGLRYDLGFAPVRLDIATPLQKVQRAGTSPFQIYLSIGQAF